MERYKMEVLFTYTTLNYVNMASIRRTYLRIRGIFLLCTYFWCAWINIIVSNRLSVELLNLVGTTKFDWFDDPALYDIAILTIWFLIEQLQNLNDKKQSEPGS